MRAAFPAILDAADRLDVDVDGDALLDGVMLSTDASVSVRLT